MWEYFVIGGSGILAGFLAGVFFEKGMNKLSKEKQINAEKLLHESFGEPVYFGAVTIEDINNWIEGRKEKISSEDKVCVVEARKDLLKKIIENIEIPANMSNYLVVAIITKESKLIEATLIKFDKIELELKEMLDKGEGCLIIEG